MNHMLASRGICAAQRLVEGHAARMLTSAATADTCTGVGQQRSLSQPLPGNLPDALASNARSEVHRHSNHSSTFSLQQCGFSRVRALSTSSASFVEEPPAREKIDVTFPPTSAGGVILGPIQPTEDQQTHERVRKMITARVFDQYYQDGSARTGRKTLAKALKGDYIGDYYLDKITDPLMTNPDGRAAAAVRAERNARGFKRRRPQKQTKKKK
eukprot:jgi/Ulvmu1/12367/UM009_0013.1